MPRQSGSQPRTGRSRRFLAVCDARRVRTEVLERAFRESRQRSSDAGLSPDGRARRRPSTEMSSSRSGQCTPMPGPINSHRRRSAADPSCSLGYHSSGTETTRPSVSSTISDWSVTRTPLAAAVSIEMLMRRLQERGFVFAGELQLHCWLAFSNRCHRS
jgi:hypothetical protein